MTDLPENWADSIGMKVNAAYLNALDGKVNNNVTTGGLLSALPAPGNLGAQYLATDAGLHLWDDGTKWQVFQEAHIGVVPTAGWSGVNLGSSTITNDRGSLLLTVPSETATGPSVANLRAAVRTLTPTSNYSAEFQLEATYPYLSTNTAVWFFGIIVRDSVSGESVTFGVGDVSASAPPVNLMIQNLPANLGSASTVMNLTAATPYPKKLRVRDAAGTRNYEFSYNGVDWLTFYTETTALLTPNQIGLAAINANTSGNTSLPLVLRLRSLEGVS